jgi:putative DNA primase/helicase
MPVLAGSPQRGTSAAIESLWIAVDHDRAGVAAARSAAARWRASGAEVFLVTPTAAGADLNDLFRGGL